MLDKIKPMISLRWRQACWLAAGLAHDYWKDGTGGSSDNSGGFSVLLRSKATKAGVPAAVVGADGLWRALPGEIAEHMWGQNCVMPGDDYLTDRMARPLGIAKDMNVLDLSAGLGGRMRKIAHEFGAYIDGLEADPDLAARGMEVSQAQGMGKRAVISPYDPAAWSRSRFYDCVLAREVIYRVADKPAFIKSVVGCCKPRAQISFTDYIVNPEVRDQPAITAWRTFEPAADPAGLVEMAEMWAKAGIDLRVHDDMTDYYKKEVIKGLAKFAAFMASGARPDDATKKAINHSITLWAHRVAAIEAGMKFYRFYGGR